MFRFVILFHETPPGYTRASHWDLMLEQHAALRTWALAEEPRAGPPIAAEGLPDHRREYLEYEGPVSGNRGHVTRWDHGTLEWESDRPGEVVVLVSGQRLRGRMRLTRTPAEDQRWDFSFEPG